MVCLGSVARSGEEGIYFTLYPLVLSEVYNEQKECITLIIVAEVPHSGRRPRSLDYSSPGRLASPGFVSGHL